MLICFTCMACWLLPPGAWDSEAACRKWLGLGQGVQPLSLTLFTRSGCSYLIEQCLDGMHTAFPGMVITGQSSRCRQPPPPLPLVLGWTSRIFFVVPKGWRWSLGWAGGWVGGGQGYVGANSSTGWIPAR